MNKCALNLNMASSKCYLNRVSVTAFLLKEYVLSFVICSCVLYAYLLINVLFNLACYKYKFFFFIHFILNMRKYVSNGMNSLEYLIKRSTLFYLLLYLF